MSPMNCADEDSEISDEEEESVGVEASAVEKSSREAVTSLVDEGINSSHEDSLLGSYTVTGLVDKSQEVGFHENEKLDEDDTWYVINQEAEALFNYIGTSHCRTQKAKREERGKLKPKISLHSRAFGEVKSLDVRKCSNPSDYEELQSDDESLGHGSFKDQRIKEHSVVEILESFQQEKKQRLDASKMPVEIVPLQGAHLEHSAVELLDMIQDKVVQLKGDLDKCARDERRQTLSEKKSAITLGDRTLNNEDPSEPICSPSSSDDEECERNLKLVSAEASGITMADKIQEALGASILNDQAMHFASSKPLGLGLFGKLQRVIQAEKEKDANFLKLQQSIEHKHDESSCLVVRVLSRYLEGKLVVCHCSITDNKLVMKHDDLLDTPKRMKEYEDCQRILIFNFRVCDDVELDVGNLVRVHSPWKEVRTARYGVVILCSYFSQMKLDDS
uniref:Uncharacterized protein n=1 Tax=Kalanchoe fedtschenkoi TaxID=63787 RepID=A0A7N0SZ66_KALFE